MKLDLANMDPKSIYLTMIQTIVPRPIAWILSDNGDQTHNLAPFSYFNGVCSKPPIISISVGKKRSGGRKDTWTNIDEREHFVVHLPRTNSASAVSATAATLPFGDSEITANNLPTVQDEDWPLPRLVESPVALLCRKHQIIEVGATPQGLVLGEILRIHLDDDIVLSGTEAELKIDIARLNPLARLGGDDYAPVGPAFTVDRPD